MTSIKEFLDKFFELNREYQDENKSDKMRGIFRDYADKLY